MFKKLFISNIYADDRTLCQIMNELLPENYDQKFIDKAGYCVTSHAKSDYVTVTFALLEIHVKEMYPMPNRVHELQETFNDSDSSTTEPDNIDADVIKRHFFSVFGTSHTFNEIVEKAIDYVNRIITFG